MPGSSNTPPPGSGTAAGSKRWYAALRARLREATAGLTIKEIADRTGTHPESARRFLSHGVPSSEFIAAFSRAFGVSTEWLLGLQTRLERTRQNQRDLERIAEALDRARDALGSLQRRG